MIFVLFYFENLIRGFIFSVVFKIFNFIFRIIFIIPNLINLFHINNKCKKSKKDLNFNHLKNLFDFENVILDYRYGRYIYTFTNRGIYYQKLNLTRKYAKNNYFYSYEDIKEINFGIKSVLGYKIHFSNFTFKNNLSQKNKLYFIYSDGNLLYKKFPKIKKILS